MYRTQENGEIGKYVGKLISRKYGADRRFAIAYIRLRDGVEKPTQEEIQKAANKVSQLKIGKKGIQITDLPIFAELLEVSVDSILSAGKVSKPVQNRMSNYSVAFSKDKKVWKEYIERPDKLILNTDEYGKTVIDYAEEFGNYGFLKYLIDTGHIWFVGDDTKDYWTTFGAGTDIERRQIGYTDILETKLRESDQLRTSLIALAVENKDYTVLDEMKAREIPELYTKGYMNNRGFEFKKSFNQQLIDSIAQADDEVLLYFSEEFDVKTKRNAYCTYTFPFLGRVIEQAIKNEKKAVPSMLKNALKHNKMILNEIKIIVDVAKKPYADIAHFTDEDDIRKRILEEFQFNEEDETITFNSGIPSAGKFQGIFSNVIRVKAKSSDKYVASLIDDVNSVYNQIKNFRG